MVRKGGVFDSGGTGAVPELEPEPHALSRKGANNRNRTMGSFERCRRMNSPPVVTLVCTDMVPVDNTIYTGCRHWALLVYGGVEPDLHSSGSSLVWNAIS